MSTRKMVSILGVIGVAWFAPGFEAADVFRGAHELSCVECNAATPWFDKVLRLCRSAGSHHRRHGSRGPNYGGGQEPHRHHIGRMGVPLPY